jgi:hypothetical protein
MKEYVNEMLNESARKKGCLCASDMTFNAQLQSTTTWHCLQIKEESV